MGLHDGLDDGQAEAEAARRVEVARPVAAHEGLEHRLALRVGDARPRIDHADPHPAIRALHHEAGLPAVLHGVVHEVGDRPLQLVGLAAHEDVAAPLHGHRGADIREAVADGLHHRGEVHEAVASRVPLLPVADEGQGRLHEAVHLVEVAQGRGPRPLVLDELGAQAQPGDRRAQVVADGGEHLRAVVDEAAHAGAHPVERARHRQHLLRPGLRQGDVVVPRAEALRRAGEPGERRRERPRGPDAEQGQRQRQEHAREDQGALAGRAQGIVGERRAEHRAVAGGDADMQVLAVPGGLEARHRHRAPGGGAQAADHRPVGGRLGPLRRHPVPGLDLDEGQGARPRRDQRGADRGFGHVEEAGQDADPRRRDAGQGVGVLRLVEQEERGGGHHMRHRDAGHHEEGDLPRDAARAQAGPQTGQGHERVTSGVNR